MVKGVQGKGPLFLHQKERKNPPRGDEKSRVKMMVVPPEEKKKRSSLQALYTEKGNGTFRLSLWGIR